MSSLCFALFRHRCCFFCWCCSRRHWASVLTHNVEGVHYSCRATQNTY